jgi:phosphoribosylformimino-5-aminoimidazole carboxamide ribotide isomerase
VQIIGVVDLKGGRAVHATGGVRDAYRPVVRAGTTDVRGDAAALAGFYRDHVGLHRVYIADLDAIAGRIPQSDIVRAMASGGPTWLDAGTASVEQALSALQTGVERIIIGLETLPDYGALEQICEAIPVDRLAFSLDLQHGRLLCRRGSPLERESLTDVVAHIRRAGITTISVIDVRRVGAQSGPAFDAVERVRETAPDAAVFAGGGVRSMADLERLGLIGVSGALLASALQDGRLTRADLHPSLSR